MRLIDTHTHHLRHNAIVDIDPVDIRLSHTDSPNTADRHGNPVLQRGYTYSVGIHPWNCLRTTGKDLMMLRSLAAEPCVKAIGETGLDTLRLAVYGKPLQAQTELLKFHVALSEELRKPLILHIVKRFQEIMRLRKELRPGQPWIIHGFRGKPELAMELLRHGFHLSYGERFNSASVAITPPSRLLIETDESQMPLSGVARRLTAARITPKTGKFGTLNGRVSKNPGEVLL